MSKKGQFRGNPAKAISNYNGWVPRPMRASVPDPKGQERSALSRRSKRLRVLGPGQKIYISAHGHKHRDYSELCRMADNAN